MDAPVGDAIAARALGTGRQWRSPLRSCCSLIGTTSVFAAPSALPGSPLYAVRSLKENLEVRAGREPCRAGWPVRHLRDRAQRPASGTDAHQQRLAGRSCNALLRDIKGEIQEANQEANSDGQGARNAVQQAEGQIGSQLNQIQQDGTLPAAQENSLSDTLLQVQAGPSGQSGQSDQSGDSSGND